MVDDEYLFAGFEWALSFSLLQSVLAHTYTVCVVSAALGLSNARQAEQPRLVLGGGDDGVACRVQLRRHHPRTLRVLLLLSTGITRRTHRPPSPHAHSRGERSHFVLGLHKSDSSTTFRSLPQSSIGQVQLTFN